MLLYHRNKYKQNPRETFQLFKTPFTKSLFFTDNEMWHEADDRYLSFLLSCRFLVQCLIYYVPTKIIDN